MFFASSEQVAPGVKWGWLGDAEVGPGRMHECISRTGAFADASEAQLTLAGREFVLVELPARPYTAVMPCATSC